MPAGTPPSAIACATGMVVLRRMIENGFLVNLDTGLIPVLLYHFVYLE